jgi:ethanolamine utilization protein EutN
MIIGTVIGNIWATRKENALTGLKLMVVQRMDPADGGKYESFVAVDRVGAGIGERVLVTTGSSARMALENHGAPVDAVIVGILDETRGREEG